MLVKSEQKRALKELLWSFLSAQRNSNIFNDSKLHPKNDPTGKSCSANSEDDSLMDFCLTIPDVTKKRRKLQVFFPILEDLQRMFL